MTQASQSSRKHQDRDHAPDGKSAPHQRRLQRTQGLVEDVYQVIRADIMALRIPPDSRISIDKLARELGVSQTPIREALSMLEAIGLVARRLYSGYWCAPQLQRSQIDDLYEARVLLEPYAARVAAQRMADADVEALARHLETMDPVRHALTYDEYADRDAELHDMIARGSRNTIIQDSLGRLHSHLHIFRMRSSSEVTIEANNEHIAVVEALCRRSGEEAEEAMRLHIRKSYERLVGEFTVHRTSAPEHRKDD